MAVAADTSSIGYVCTPGGDGLPVAGVGSDAGLLEFLEEHAELCVSQTIRTKPQAKIVHDDPQLVLRELGLIHAFVATR